MATIDRKRDRLVWLASAPAIWAAHFLVCYGVAAIVCAKLAGRDGTIGAALPWLLGLTALALAAIGAIGWRGWRAHRHAGGSVPHDEDTPEDRHRLLGLATFLLAALSAVAVSYTALALVLAGSCR